MDARGHRRRPRPHRRARSRRPWARSRQRVPISGSSRASAGLPRPSVTLPDVAIGPGEYALRSETDAHGRRAAVHGHGAVHGGRHRPDLVRKPRLLGAAPLGKR